MLKGSDIRDQFGAISGWSTSTSSRRSISPSAMTSSLACGRCWDLAIVDEAHRMSWTPPARKTERYALGELIRDTTDHLLLLTATPHKGDPTNFSLFLQLLDRDAYADVRSLRVAMDRGQAPFYLRRTKEAMVYFPERQPNGAWIARKIFTQRIPHTVAFQIDGAEFALYQDVTRFVKRQSARAAAQSDDPGPRSRWLLDGALSTAAGLKYAPCGILQNRASRLAEGLQRAQTLARQAPPVLPIQKNSKRWKRASVTAWNASWRQSRWPVTPSRCTRRLPSCVACAAGACGGRGEHGGEAGAAQGTPPDRGFLRRP